MRTVDALTAARDFFVANPERWTTGALARQADARHERACFCALGGISKVTGCFTDDGLRTVGGIFLSCLSGPIKAVDPATNEETPIPKLPKSVLKSFSDKGVSLMAAYNAVRYANAAAKLLFWDKGPRTAWFPARFLVDVNDLLGYEDTIKCLNLAIKLAKRRTIWGNASRKPKAAKAVAA